MNAQNGIFKVLFTQQIEDDESIAKLEEKYKEFDYKVVKSISKEIAFATCDALVNGSNF